MSLKAQTKSKTERNWGSICSQYCWLKKCIQPRKNRLNLYLFPAHFPAFNRRMKLFELNLN